MKAEGPVTNVRDKDLISPYVINVPTIIQMIFSLTLFDNESVNIKLHQMKKSRMFLGIE